MSFEGGRRNWKELERCQMRTHGHTQRGKRTATYSSWEAMKDRCNRKKCKAYPNYGGRGIRYCTEWEDFSVFLADMGEKPQGFTLERINNDGHYTKANCQWVPMSQQSRNRRGVLTQGKVLMIRKMLRDGLPQRKIATLIGCHQTTVSLINSGKTWR